MSPLRTSTLPGGVGEKNLKSTIGCDVAQFFMRSLLGSKSGSAQIIPVRQLPKNSTSTLVPTPVCSIGR